MKKTAAKKTTKKKEVTVKAVSKKVSKKTIIAKGVVTPEQRKGNLVYVAGNGDIIAQPFNRKGRKKGSYSAKPACK